MTQNKIAKPKAKSGRINLAPVWNVLAILMLLGTCCVMTFVVLLVTNPNLPVNPFPPSMSATPTLTSTPTLRVFPATWTPTSTFLPFSFGTQAAVPTLAIIASQTPRATLTPVPATATVSQPTMTLPASLPVGMFFTVDGLITQGPAISKNPDAGCNWLGVGGVVKDPAGNALVGITLKLTGELNFNIYDQNTLSGAALQYGPGGYEFYLGDTLIATQGSLFIQVMGDNGQPVSEKIVFDTYSDCQRNLISINFRQIQ